MVFLFVITNKFAIFVKIFVISYKIMRNYILRPKYFDRIKPFMDKELIKVFIGQRRVGKSYLLFQIMDYVKKLNSDVNIIYINKELADFDVIRDNETLYAYVKSKTRKNETNYIFIDEVQLIDKFELTLKSLVAEGNFDIYITGSNANLLSSELATLLSGRYIEIKVFPLDYTEFLTFHKLKDNTESFNKYVKYGGMPYLKNLQLEDDIIFEYLQNIYQAILYKDVVARNKVRNVNFLENLINFLAKNIGSPVSATSISKYLKSQNVRMAATTVIDYLHFLANAFIIGSVSKYDIQGKKIFSQSEKFYYTDIGIRNAITGFSPFDLGQIIENLVFNHLQNHNYKVYQGRIRDLEIDFVAQKKGETYYFQVALNISKVQTLKREVGNLLKIRDNYPKYLITFDEIVGSSFEGVKHLPLRIFLSDFV